MRRARIAVIAGKAAVLLIVLVGGGMAATESSQAGMLPGRVTLAGLLVLTVAILAPLIVTTLLRERRLREVEDLRARLDRRERVLEMVVDTVSSGIVAFDANGQIEMMNEAARRMLNLPRGSRDPASWPPKAQFRPTEQGARGGAPVWAMLMGKRIRGAEYLLHVEDRKEPLRVRVNAEPAPLGGPIGAVMTLEDITEQHRARVLGDRADRLDALGKLTGGVAHDFNNLLSTIMGAVQLAERRSGGDPRIARHLETALRATRTGAELVERLLGFAKRGSARIDTVPVDELIEEVKSLASNIVGPAIALAYAVPEKPLSVRCDRAQIVTALLNLIANARDAIEAAQRQGRIRLIVGPSGERADMAEIAVCDNGTGMTEDVRARALDPFFTTKGAARGTGLGLSMVYGALRRCGGDLRIDSMPGEGTAVRLLLPQAAPVVTAPTGTAPAPAGGGGRAVLLVEDEVDLLDTAEAMLFDLGYAVIRAPDAATALREIQSGRVVDILVTDLMMPGGMDGIALAQAARTRLPGLPVVLASGYVEGASACAGVDGAAVVRKPYSMEELSAALRVALVSAPRHMPPAPVLAAVSNAARAAGAR
jgi:signal transduction histidine kinase/ActR/RegA family two-component response regulator